MKLLRLIFRKEKRTKKGSVIKEFINNPDEFNYNIEVNNGEIIIRIKKVEDLE